MPSSLPYLFSCRGSCFLAGPTQNVNWAKLELEKETNVGTVAVYPRLDYYAYEVISGAEVNTKLDYTKLVLTVCSAHSHRGSINWLCGQVIELW